MSERNIVVICVWRSEGFVVIDARLPPEDEPYLMIDENKSKITVQIPANISLITKKIIERRVQSIAKSGFKLPNMHIRVGRGFEVTMSKNEAIPDVLLQEGHKYSLDSPQPYTEDTKPEIKVETSTETEYIPTFLKQDQSMVVSDTSKKDLPIYEVAPESAVTTDQGTFDDLSVAGRFIVILSRTGEVYLSRKNDHYSVEYSAGRVDFIVKDGDIQILSKKRFSPDDQTLNQAISAATNINL
ncbi:MAG: hypothetical protein ACXAC8_12690 [Candidatus Hodarchaeales archaeon]|jgi:hypothetical protein